MCSLMPEGAVHVHLISQLNTDVQVHKCNIHTWWMLRFKLCGCVCVCVCVYVRVCAHAHAHNFLIFVSFL